MHREINKRPSRTTGRQRRAPLHAALLVVLALLCTATATSRGDTPPLTAEPASASISVRSGAPVTIVWKLNSQSTSLLEGRLELTVRDGHERLARLVTDEIVLTPGEQLFRTVVPPLYTSSPVNSTEMVLKFSGTHGTIDLGSHGNLRLPSPWQRSLVVGFCDAWQTSLPRDLREFLETFRLESYNVDKIDRSLTTGLAHVPGAAMPTDPLGYFAYDILVLVGRALGELKTAQLQAISAWVNAGGSLAIAPGRDGLREEQIRFINAFFPTAENAPFAFDDTGRLLPAPESDQSTGAKMAERLILKRFGLGRVAVIRESLESLVSAHKSDVYRLIGFLWKLRNDQVADFGANGYWSVSVPGIQDAAAVQPGAMSSQQMQDLMARVRPSDMKLSPLPIQSGDQLLARLMPRNLRVVPMSLIALLMALYVLLVGPVDYWILGKLRKRRFTWVLFPAVTVGFAVGTVSISDWYMRVADNRRTVRILDIGEAGKVARTNRLDLLFRSRQGEAVTPVKRAYFAAMNHQEFMRGSWYNYQTALRSGTENQLELVAPPQIAGRVPSQYAVAQYLPQWTPQLNRICTLSSDEEQPAIDFDWNGLARLPVPGANLHLPDGPGTQIREAVQKTFGSDAGIFVVTGRGIVHVAGPSGTLQRDDPLLYDTNIAAGQPAIYAGQSALSASTFLYDICSGATQEGWFNIVSQISPNGGTEFHDLALLDPSDPRQWLLVVIVDQGDDLIVYRKLYTGE